MQPILSNQLLTNELGLLEKDLARMPLAHLHDYPGAVYLAQSLLDFLHIRIWHRFLFADSSALLLCSVRVYVERIDDLELP